MANVEMSLVCTELEGVVTALAHTDDSERPETSDASAWARAREVLAEYGVGEDDDVELALAVEAEDAPLLTEIVAGWVSGKRLLLVRDREVLKRAMKAYRKRLKLTVLDDESSLSGGDLSSGRASSIVGIHPPDRYPRATWDHLVRQGRLAPGRGGTYELGPNG